VLYLSDVLDAGGKCINKRYLERREQEEKWSTLIFPKENPPRRDFRLWRKALLSIAPRGRLAMSIGSYNREGRKIWPWRIDTERNRLYHIKEDSTMDVYTYANDPTLARRPIPGLGQRKV
jgi:hypothetical protein